MDKFQKDQNWLNHPTDFLPHLKINDGAENDPKSLGA